MEAQGTDSLPSATLPHHRELRPGPLELDTVTGEGPGKSTPTLLTLAANDGPLFKAIHPRLPLVRR